jgi:solute carrier family 30 (zinc transporter), member 2
MEPRTAPAAHAAEVRVLMTACALTFLFFLVELVGGMVAGSLAIMSDAAHMLSDTAGFGISLLALSISRLPASAAMSFGFARAEVLGALVSVLFIWALTIVLVVFAIQRFFVPEPVNGPLMLVLGVIGLVVNIMLGLVLGGHHHHGHGGHSHGRSHSHSHGHAHSHPHSDSSHTSSRTDVVFHAEDLLAPISNGNVALPKYGANGRTHDHTHDHDDSNDRDHDHDHSGAHGHDHEHDRDHNHGDDHGADNRLTWSEVFFGNSAASLNLRAAYLHVLGDALQNIGVILAALIIWAKPSWSFIDPVCTLVFACIVVMTTRGLAVESIVILMEGTPPSIAIADVYKALVSIPGVSRVSDLHVWSLTASRHALSAVLFTSTSVGHAVLKTAQRILHERFGIDHATVQVSNCIEEDCCDDDHPEGPTRNCVSSSSLAAVV